MWKVLTMTTDVIITTTDTPTLKELSVFLSRYSARLLGAGATAIRLEKNVTRIARAYGAQVEILILPAHVHISVWHENSTDSVTSLATVTHKVISYNVNTRLSQLSWEVADGEIGFEEARRRFEEIVHSDKQNKWVVMVLVTLANASFCRLFGGDPQAMLAVAAATLAGYYLKIVLLEHHTDVRVMVTVCALLSSVIAGGAVLFDFGNTPDVALATSVLYLVPGIPFLNSFSDMLHRHYLCALSRFVDATILTCCLSAGLCMGLWLLNLGMF